MLHGRRHAADELHGGVDCALERGGQRGPVGGALGGHAQLAERVARVRVPPARVPPRHEVVVHERSQQPAVAEERHEGDEREQHDLSEGGGAQDVARLELHQGDQQASHPHRVLAQGIKDGERVGRSVQQSEQEDRRQDQQIGCNIHEDERVEQVVRTVFQEEPGHELPRDGDLARRDALVQSEC